MSKEISASDIEHYVQANSTKQGESHKRNLLERYWLAKRRLILASTGKSRKDFKGLFNKYKMTEIADCIELERSQDPEDIALSIWTLPSQVEQANSIRAALASGELNVANNEPRVLLEVANMTEFENVQFYIAKIMKRRRHEPAYEDYQGEIDRLLRFRRETRRERLLEYEPVSYEAPDFRVYFNRNTFRLLFTPNSSPMIYNLVDHRPPDLVSLYRGMFEEQDDSDPTEDRGEEKAWLKQKRRQYNHPAPWSKEANRPKNFKFQSKLRKGNYI